MVARRADSELVGLPPRLERRVLNTDLEERLLDLAESGLGEELGEVPLARTGELRLVHDVLVERERCFPEDADRPARRRDPTHAATTPCAGHTCHLPEPADRVTHEVDDELRERGVETRVRERDALRGSLPDADTGIRSRGLATNGSDGSTAVTASGPNLARARRSGRPARSRRRARAPPCRCWRDPQEGRERDGVAPHEAVIRARGDRKAHVRTLEP